MRRGEEEKAGDDKESSVDAQMTGESDGNSLGETHCRRNVSPNY